MNFFLPEFQVDTVQDLSLLLSTAPLKSVQIWQVFQTRKNHNPLKLIFDLIFCQCSLGTLNWDLQIFEVIVKCIYFVNILVRVQD